MSRASIRVLVVEDHFLARLAVTTLVGDASDMTVVAVAETGKQAIELVAAHAPDVVLMDLRLPELDGVGATAAICAAHPGARVLVLSNYESDEEIAGALAAGARGFLRKDVSGPELLDAIRRVAQGLRYLPANVANKLAERQGQAALTTREVEVLEHVFKGGSNRDIARALDITEGTVRIHVSNILLKLGVKRRTEAVAVALKRGILRAE